MQCNDFKIVVLKEDYNNLQKKFGEKARNGLKEKVIKKRKEINKVTHFNDAKRRFYKSFSHNGVCFVEVNFFGGNNQYRAVFLADGKTKSFVYVDSISKASVSDNYMNSVQKELFDAVSNSGDVYDAARDKCLKFVEA